MKNFTYSLFLAVLPLLALAQPMTQARMDSIDRIRINYIAHYKDLAILEMYKSGIPASITLAQGLLETAAGTSLLAREANNHFGMKCGSNWSGTTFHKADDEFDNSGSPLKSCFRSYPDAEDNFADHSDFLRDPQKHNRYGALFLLDPLDYAAWAVGLQASGYSPVGHYSARLIENIERYHLHEFDYKAWNERKKMPARHRITKVNDVRLVRATEGETLAEIALSCGADISSVIEYNERRIGAYEPLVHGTPVFIEEKKQTWEGSDLEFFFIHDGKNFFETAQLFGIKEAALRNMNKVLPNQEPAIESKIRLRGQSKSGEKVKLTTQAIKSPGVVQPRNKKPPLVPEKSPFPINKANQEQLFMVLVSPVKGSWSNFQVISNTGNSVNEVTVGNVLFYDVSKGDTLAAIARKYNTSISTLRQINQLISDNLQIGQRLRVK